MSADSLSTIEPDAQRVAAQRRYAGARRLADTRTLERSAWLAIRRRGLGSSDAAAAVGLDPFISPLALWMEKTGRCTEPEFDPESDSPMYWGRVLEPIVARHYARRSGCRVRRVNAVLQHPQHPWMLANLDREVIGNAAVQILECKTTGPHGIGYWRDGVPEYVQLQVMHQLAVTGRQAADVAVLLGGQQLAIHRVIRDEVLIERLIARERAFWRWVEQDRPPPADASASSARALRALFPTDNGESLDFTEDEGLSQTFATLQEVQQHLDDLKTREAALRHRLQQAMGEATQARFATGRVSWKRARDSQRLDGKTLRTDHPALYARYQKTIPGARRFVIHEGGG